MVSFRSVALVCAAVLWPADMVRADVDLLAKYPTTLIAGDTEPGNACEWSFEPEDIYEVSGFRLEAVDDSKPEGEQRLAVTIGPADVGIGHCERGAVWAIVIPRATRNAAGGSPAGSQATLKSWLAKDAEEIDHVWLRFHPRKITMLFPPATVVGPGDAGQLHRMQRIVAAKFTSSWHAGMGAMIPDPNYTTVDLDTTGGVRRFFSVEATKAGGATGEPPWPAKLTYIPAFESRVVPAEEPIDRAAAEAGFDMVWTEFDRRYAMFVLRPDVDWAKLRDEYRPKAVAAKTRYEFACVLADMLRSLRDLHIWVKVGPEYVPVFNRPRASNANPQAYAKLIGDVRLAGSAVQWGRTADGVGFIAIHGWSDNAISQQVDEALDQLRDTRGLILDVRLNGGGDEVLARQVAGRFADREIVYAYSQYRNGPKHEDLTERLPRSVQPRGAWRYDRPVIVLIGQKCMSSNESFVAMMGECPNVTLMGDRTCGSSGNPAILTPVEGLTVSLPQWIDLLPDGSPLDKRGVQPDVPFAAAEDAFSGDDDPLLAAALERMHREPKPAEPIATPNPEPKESAETPVAIPGAPTAAQSESVNRPKVVEVWPADGATDVPLDARLRIRFDRPMDPHQITLQWQAGGYCDSRQPEYNAAKNEFVFPLQLPPETRQTVQVNPRFGRHEPEGFESEDGVDAQSYTWSFTTAAATVVADAEAPKVVSIEPPLRSETALIQPVVVRFDQPMDPKRYVFASLAGDWLTSANALPYVRYNDDQHAFSFVLRLPVGAEGRVQIRELYSVNGRHADPVTLTYRASDALVPDDVRRRFGRCRQDPKLLDVLQKMKAARANLRSTVETVADVQLVYGENGGMSIRGWASVFKMQGERQFIGDVSGIMRIPFVVGSDGRQCWLYCRSDSETLSACPYEDVKEKNVCLCDPFDLLSCEVGERVKDLYIEYLGEETVSGRRCHVISAWYAERRDQRVTCDINRWWIDAETWRPVMLVQDIGINLRSIRRFDYERVNDDLPIAEFQPRIKSEAGPPEPLGEGYDRYFLNVKDGSDGYMSVRWGKKGEKGTYSGGLN